MKLAVTGTNTGVGKTMITAMLAASWHSKGKQIEVQKWVSTGYASMAEDLRLVYEAMGKPVPPPGSPNAPYCLKFPASPHLAARLEGIQIDKKRLIDATSILEATCDTLIIEGAGGPFSPVNDETLFVNLISELHIPLVLVTTTTIGTINQTLCHITALEHRGIRVIAIVFNEKDPEDRLIATDSINFIAQRTDIPVLGPVPHLRQPMDMIHLHDNRIPDTILKLLEDIR